MPCFWQLLLDRLGVLILIVLIMSIYSDLQRYFNNTEGTMTAIDTACGTQISKNETNLSSDPAAATIVTDIEKLSCENDCSGNGICQAGNYKLLSVFFVLL